MWAEAGQRSFTRRSDIRSSWPNEEISLYGPGTASGTYDDFSEVILGEDTTVRSDYAASEDDELLAQGIEGNPSALGYFGFAYFGEHEDTLKALAVDNGAGPVSPSQTTVESSHISRFRDLYLSMSMRKPLKKILLCSRLCSSISNRPQPSSVRLGMCLYLKMGTMWL